MKFFILFLVFWRATAETTCSNTQYLAPDSCDICDKLTCFDYTYSSETCALLGKLAPDAPSNQDNTCGSACVETYVDTQTNTCKEYTIDDQVCNEQNKKGPSTSPLNADRQCDASCDNLYALGKECKECLEDSHCPFSKHCGHQSKTCTQDFEVDDACFSAGQSEHPECLSGLCKQIGDNQLCKCQQDSDCSATTECHSNECYLTFSYDIYSQSSLTILGVQSSCNDPYYVADAEGNCQRASLVGCMNPLSSNYDSNVLSDDGSCILPNNLQFEEEAGQFQIGNQKNPALRLCKGIDIHFERVGEGHALRVFGHNIDETINENSAKTIQFNIVGSYTYVCTSHPSMTNSIEVVECDSSLVACPSSQIPINGVCVDIVRGCTNAEALNYDPNANVDENCCLKEQQDGFEMKYFDQTCKSKQKTCQPGEHVEMGNSLTSDDWSCQTTICQQNQHVQNNACEPCQPGSIRDAGDEATGDDTQCTDVNECDSNPCLNGECSESTTDSSIALNTYECLCPKGYGGQQCVVCSGSTYQPNDNHVGACLNKKTCPAGEGLYKPETESTIEDDFVCVPCNQATTGFVIAPDTSNTFNDDPQSTATCHPHKTWQECTSSNSAECANLNCNIGHYLKPGTASENAVCTPCPAGQYSLIDDQTCTPCPLGTHQPNEGQGSCIDCGHGTYADTTGLSECQKCSAGFVHQLTRQESIDSCQECPAGEYQSAEGQAECTKCPVGKSGSQTSSGSSGGSLTCTADSDCNGDTCIQGNCYIVKPEYGKGGTCDEIITEAECAALNPDNYFNFVDANNDFAPGCLKSGNAYRYNPGNPTGVCGEYGYKCVCRKPAPAQDTDDTQDTSTGYCIFNQRWIWDSICQNSKLNWCFKAERTKEDCESGSIRPNTAEDEPSCCKWSEKDSFENGGTCKAKSPSERGSACTNAPHPAMISMIDGVQHTYCSNLGKTDCIDFSNGNADNGGGYGASYVGCCEVVQTRRRLNNVRDSLDACFDCEVGTYADVEGLAECKLCQAGTFQDVVGQTSCKPLIECPAPTLVSNENEANKEKSSQNRECHHCDLSSATIANGAYNNLDCDSGTDCPHTCDRHYTPNTASCSEGILFPGTCTDIDDCPSVDCGVGICDGSVPTPNTYDLGYSCTCHAGYSLDNNGLCTVPGTNTIEFKSNLKRSHYSQGDRSDMSDNSMELCQGDSYYLRMISDTAHLSGPSIDTTIDTVPKHLLFLEGTYLLQRNQYIFNIHVEACGVVKAKELSVRKNIREMKQDFVGVSRNDVAKVDQNGDTLFFKLQFRNLREMIQKSNILIKHGGKPQKKNRAGETFASKVLNEASSEKDNKLLRKFFKTSTLRKRKKPLSNYNGVSLNAQSTEADYEAAEEAIALVEGVHKTQVFVHRIESRRRRLLQDNGVDIFDDCDPNDADCECNGYLLNGECTLYSVCLEDEYIQVWGGEQDHACAPKESCPLGEGVISEAIDATSTSDSIPTTCVVCDGVGTYSDQQMSTLYNVPALCDTDADCPNACVDGECVLKETGDCVSDQECLGYCGDDYKCREYVDHIDPDIYTTGCKQIYDCTANEIQLVAPSESQNRQCQCKWGYGRLPVDYAPAQSADPHLNHNRECIDCGQNTLSGGRCNCPDNHFSRDLECHPCQGTSVNTDHVDPLISGDTEEACVCLAGTRVATEGSSNTCVPCPSGYTSVEASVLLQNICIEDPNLCKVNEYVSFGRCVSCPPGTTNRKGDDKTGPNTECDDNLCLNNQHVALINNEYVCLQCPANSFCHSGDDPSNGFETTCCPINTYETVVADIYYPGNQVCSTDNDCAFAQKCLSGLCAQAIDRQCMPCGTNSQAILQTYEDLDCCRNVGSQTCQRLKIDKDLHCEASC